jgi:Holliday junction resolvasome RuvABC ATP-dependent DNA helicase subunit
VDNCVQWLIKPLIGTNQEVVEYKDPLIGVPLDLSKYPDLRAKTRDELFSEFNQAVAIEKTGKKYYFKDYLGQTKAKTILSKYISKFKGKALPHIIIHGNAGCGKTTLARTIATEHNVPFVEVISKSISSAQHLVKIIESANGGIVFIDELHGLKRERVEIIYSMMEDFKYNGKDITPFTLIGATTEYGELLRSRRPFVDRFKVNIELEPYTSDIIEELTKNYAKKNHPKKR